MIYNNEMLYTLGYEMIAHLGTWTHGVTLGPFSSRALKNTDFTLYLNVEMFLSWHTDLCEGSV